MDDYDLKDFSLQKQFEFHKMCSIIDDVDDIEDLKKASKNFLYLYFSTQVAAIKLAEWDNKIK